MTNDTQAFISRNDGTQIEHPTSAVPVFTPPQTAADIYAMVDSCKRVPIDRARAILAVGQQAAERLAYVASTYPPGQCPYTAATDPAIIDGAFNGHVLQALASLADAYEREITHA